MKKIILFTFVLLFNVLTRAQTFNGTGGIIPDLVVTPSPTYFACTVSGLPSSIDTTFGIERVCLNITHTYDQDLEIKLMSPDNFVVMLSNRNGGSNDNFTATCFRGMGTDGMISLGTAPFTGEYDPDGDLRAYMNGRNPNGIWHLVVTDMSSIDTGRVNSFQIIFSSNVTPHSRMPCSTTDPSYCLCPDGSQVCDLLPDMTASAEAILTGSYESGDTVYVNNATPNIGWGPLEIHGISLCYCDTNPVSCTTTACPVTGLPPKQLVMQTVYHKDHGTVSQWMRSAGSMTYHPSHGHTHLDNWASYSLRRPVYGLSPIDWPVVGQGYKQSYCLVNLGQCSTTGNNYCVDSAGTPLGRQNIPNYGMGAVTGCGIDQGIFVGNYDVYSAGLTGQWIILDSLCNGDYYIVSITDPGNVILESNENNNWAASPFTLLHQLNLPFPSVNFSFSGMANTVNFVNSSIDYDSLHWDFGDGGTDTASNPSHTYSTTGTYIVVLNAFNHCGLQQQVDTIDLTLIGIYEGGFQDVTNYKVYPNPASSQVKIDFSMAKAAPVSLNLYDSFGNLIKVIADKILNMGNYHFVIDAAQLNLSHGVYTVKLTSASTNLVSRIVFIE
ncbi:MAG: PKD domain-containing protein [Bacteroidetes bacterium]|nr:PKD domain-containing protein [Bacteroidota bacterium]